MSPSKPLAASRPNRRLPGAMAVGLRIVSAAFLGLSGFAAQGRVTAVQQHPFGPGQELPGRFSAVPALKLPCPPLNSPDLLHESKERWLIHYDCQDRSRWVAGVGLDGRSFWYREIPPAASADSRDDYLVEGAGKDGVVLRSFVTGRLMLVHAADGRLQAMEAVRLRRGGVSIYEAGVIWRAVPADDAKVEAEADRIVRFDPNTGESRLVARLPTAWPVSPSAYMLRFLGEGRYLGVLLHIGSRLGSKDIALWIDPRSGRIAARNVLIAAAPNPSFFSERNTLGQSCADLVSYLNVGWTVIRFGIDTDRCPPIVAPP